MKVFISSVISGMEEQREAAANAIESLGHEVIRAETFAASQASPRLACLGGVREANLVVLVLGYRYGEPLPPEQISATHQEYREAKNEKPVLAFIDEEAEFESAQAKFVKEVEDWENGVFRGRFSSAENLRREVTRSLHQHELASAVAPVDGAQLLEDACDLLRPTSSRRSYSSSGPRLRLALASGPVRRVLRPAEIEAEELKDTILKEALFGASAVFDTGSGNSVSNVDDSLVVSQENGDFLSLSENGHIAFALKIDTHSGALSVLVEEDVQAKMERAFRLGNFILDHIDRSQKLSRVAIAASMEGADYVAWRKRSEFDPNATSITLGHSFRDEKSSAVHLNPADVARSALGFDAGRIAEDLTTLLRRRGEG